MNCKKILFVLICLTVCRVSCSAQEVMASPEYIKALTAQWTGKRLPDGRPYLSDNLLERLKKRSLEEIWAELIDLGYHNQFEGDWQLLKEDESAVMTGRAVTAQFMPDRPDLLDQVIEQGKKEGHIWQQRRTMSWAINTLKPGDVYVADGYNKQSYGTIVGSNLGTGVYQNSKNGAVIYGHVRDVQNLRKVGGKDFNLWIKGSDPSYMRKTQLVTINHPVRIGQAIVLPGDAVLAKKEGVIFIPAQFVEQLVIKGEVTELFDDFGQERIAQHIYSAGQIDSKWTDEIKNDFRSWVNEHESTLPMPKKELLKYLEERNF